MYCDHNSQYCLLPLSQEVQGLVTQKLLVLKKRGLFRTIVYYGAYVELEPVPLELASVSVELGLVRTSPPVKFRFTNSSVLFCEKATPKLLVTSTTAKITAASPKYFLYEISLFSIMIN